MSIQGSAWALDCVKGLGLGVKAVVFALGEYADENGVTWASRARLMDRAECSDRSLTTHLKTLQEVGLITCIPRYVLCESQAEACASRPPHKHRRGTIFQLHFDRSYDGQQKAGLTSAKIADVEELLETQEKVHTRKNCGSEDPAPSTPAKLGSPHPQPVAGIVQRKRTTNIEPPSLTKPYPNPTTEADAGFGLGQVRLGENEPESDAGAQAEAAGETSSSVGGREGGCEPLGTAFTPVAHPGEGELALIATCLPQAMQALDAQGARMVATLLAERIAAGWTPSQIRAVVGENLPPRVHRMAGLVARRLTDCVVPSLAPSHLAEQAEKQANAQRAELMAAAVPEDEIMTPDERERAQRMEAMRRENPEWPMAKIVRVIYQEEREKAKNLAEPPGQPADPIAV